MTSAWCITHDATENGAVKTSYWNGTAYVGAWSTNLDDPTVPRTQPYADELRWWKAIGYTTFTDWLNRAGDD